MDNPIYVPSAGGALRQGEVLSEFKHPYPDVDKLRNGAVELIPEIHPYIVVISQDCDLEQDFGRRAKGETRHLLASVLFCHAITEQEFVGTYTDLGKDRLKVIRQNSEPRYHYLREAIGTEDRLRRGVPSLVIDFKRHFSVPTGEAYFWAESAARRCRLGTPYAEHLSIRFASYLCRIALPLDHHVPRPESTPSTLGSEG